MHRVCCYCAERLEDCEPLDDERTSHVVCPACAAHFDEQVEARLGDYLDKFAVPVIVLKDGLVWAANGALARIVEHDREALRGETPGEALECAHARLPGGCGQQVHCRTCAIRIAINAALRGEVTEGAAAYVSQTDRRLTLRVSARLIAGLVRVDVEDVKGR